MLKKEEGRSNKLFQQLKDLKKEIEIFKHEKCKCESGQNHELATKLQCKKLEDDKNQLKSEISILNSTLRY